VGKKDKPPQTTPKQNIYAEKVMLCIWWDCIGIVYYELLPKNQTINSKKYCSQLDRLKAAIDEKHPELSSHHGVVFHQDNARSQVSLTTWQNYCTLAGMFCLIRLIRLILHHQIFIYSDLCKILLLEKILLLWKIAKSTLKSFSPIKLGSSGKMEFSNCLKGGPKLLKKTMKYIIE